MNKFLRPAIVFRIIIAVAYVILGIALLILKFSDGFLSAKTKTALAVLVILYGSFRMYRALKMTEMEDEI